MEENDKMFRRLYEVAAKELVATAAARNGTTPLGRELVNEIKQSLKVARDHRASARAVRFATARLEALRHRLLSDDRQDVREGQPGGN